MRFCRPDPLVARLRQQQTLGAKPKYHKDQKSISKAESRYWYFSLWCLGKAPPFQFILNSRDISYSLAYFSNSPRTGCKNEMDAFRAESDLGKLFFLIKTLLFALSDLPWKHFTIFHFTFTSSTYLELNCLQPAFGVGRRFLSPKLYQCKIFFVHLLIELPCEELITVWWRQSF